MKRIRTDASPRYVLYLLDHSWRSRIDLAKLLHCHPNQVHRRLLTLAKGAFTVVHADNAFAVLPYGWQKKDLKTLINDCKNRSASPTFMTAVILGLFSVTAYTS